MDDAMIPGNVPTCAKLGFDAQFAIFAVPLSSFRSSNVCFPGVVLFVLFSAYICCGAEPFLQWSTTYVTVKGEKNRFAPSKTITKFILFLSTFCQVCAFVYFNIFCHLLLLFVPIGKGFCEFISADVLECYTHVFVTSFSYIDRSHVFAIEPHESAKLILEFSSNVFAK